MKVSSGRRALRLASSAAVAALALAGAPASAGAPAVLVLERDDGGSEEVSLAPQSEELLLHFWATWCASCVDELPLLDRAARACLGSGLRIALVNVGETREEVRAFQASKGLELPSLRDADARAFRAVGGRGLPLNVARTRDGVATEVGPRDAAAWQDALAEFGCTLSDARTSHRSDQDRPN